MRCQNLNSQKDSLKEQSGRKSPVKPTWSEKMTVLSTFLESQLNFLSNNRKKTLKNLVVRERSCVKILTARNISLKRQSGTKSPVKPTCSEKMIVLRTFLESQLNFLSNNRKKTLKNLVVRERSGVKVWTVNNKSLKGQSGTKSPVKHTPQFDQIKIWNFGHIQGY